MFNNVYFEIAWPLSAVYCFMCCLSLIGNHLSLLMSFVLASVLKTKLVDVFCTLWERLARQSDRLYDRPYHWSKVSKGLELLQEFSWFWKVKCFWVFSKLPRWHNRTKIIIYCSPSSKDVSLCAFLVISMTKLVRLMCL